MRKFTVEHEWIDVDDNGTATVGITAHSAEQLGDVVFVDLPTVGAELSMDDDACVVESVKAASEIFSPVDMTVTEINTNLLENPKLINTNPEDDAWFFKGTVSNPEQLDKLLDDDAYNKLIDI